MEEATATASVEAAQLMTVKKDSMETVKEMVEVEPAAGNSVANMEGEMRDVAFRSRQMTETGRLLPVRGQRSKPRKRHTSRHGSWSSTIDHSATTEGCWTTYLRSYSGRPHEWLDT